MACSHQQTELFFQTWLQQVEPKLQSQILVGASAIFWSTWLTRNDIVFDKKILLHSNLQVIFSVIY